MPAFLSLKEHLSIYRYRKIYSVKLARAERVETWKGFLDSPHIQKPLRIYFPKTGS
jgi:hypothetical protein